VAENELGTSLMCYQPTRRVFGPRLRRPEVGGMDFEVICTQPPSEQLLRDHLLQ
jgi:hypothetical protein